MSIIPEQFNLAVPVTHQSYIPTHIRENDLFALPESDVFEVVDESIKGREGIGDSDGEEVPFVESLLAFGIVMVSLIGLTLGRNKVRKFLFGSK